MMDCQTVRDELHVEPANIGVQTHLAGCARCTAYAQRMARLDGVLRGELSLAAPAALSAELQTLALPAPALSRVEAAARAELLLPVPAALQARLLALVPQPAPEPVRVQTPLDSALRDGLLLQAPADLTARLQALIPAVPSAAPVVAPPSVPAPVARPRRWVVATVYMVTSALLLLSLLYAGQLYSLVLAQFGLQEWLTAAAELPGQLLTQLYAYVPQARAVIGLLVSFRQPLQWILVALVLWAVIDMSQRQRTGESRQQYA